MAGYRGWIEPGFLDAAFQRETPVHLEREHKDGPPMYVAWTLLVIAVLALAWLTFELAVTRQERDRLKMRNDVYEQPVITEEWSSP